MNTQNNERRRFTRIPFDAECELHSDKGSAVVQLVDISLAWRTGRVQPSPAGRDG